MEYIAHTTENKEQSLKSHLEGTAALAQSFAEAFGYGDWGYCCGLLHDIGKYSEAFQELIRGEYKQVDHSTAGAQLCAQLNGMYSFLCYCISGHHSGIPDKGVLKNASNTLLGRLSKKIEDYSAYKTEIEIPELKNKPFVSKDKDKQTFVYSMFIRMLYSCLVDADYLDTEKFMKNESVERPEGEDLETLLERLKDKTKDWLNVTDLKTTNGCRSEILRNCYKIGEESKKGLFTLTAPTGGGKTISSLAFALQHAVKNGMNRIIYVIPYTSIIEQTAKEYKKYLGKSNVLEDHCNLDLDTEGNLHLATENWDMPVVITTNVQFFESLYSNKPSKCRKLHNIANSVIIFDEAHMFPCEYIKPCVAAIEELITHYNCSSVLCTATQPVLAPFFSEDLKPFELCPKLKEQSRFFKKNKIIIESRLTVDELVDRLNQEQQALCILNTKAKVKKVYSKLKGEGIYHLSTYMYPEHRTRVLSEVKKRLEAGERCVVVATSIMEAGVDISFDYAYRELAGIDSMNQTDGRCDRNRLNDESIFYIFTLKDYEKDKNQSMQIDAAKYVLEEYEDISSPEAISMYFKLYYHYKKDLLDKKKIMEQFTKMNFPFKTVSQAFRVIEDSNKTVFVAKEEKAQKLLKEIQEKGLTRYLLRKTGPYYVKINSKEFESLCEKGKIAPVFDECKDNFYVLCDNDLYSEKEGFVVG